jgi:TPR repeat protein
MAAIKAGDCARLAAWVNDPSAEGRAARDYVAGLMYEEGFCVERDAGRAQRLFDSAKASPDVAAASNIGLRYALGDVLPQSYLKSGRWLSFADGVLVKMQAGLGSADLPKVPPIDGSQGAQQVWFGYLVSAHYVGTQILRRQRGVTDTLRPAEAVATLCPAADGFSLEIRTRADPAGGASARTKAQQDVADAYRKAKELLPTSGLPAFTPEAQRLCIERRIEYKLR